jgi:NADH-quinone oxidoreductase subunit J
VVARLFWERKVVCSNHTIPSILYIYIVKIGYLYNKNCKMLYTYYTLTSSVAYLWLILQILLLFFGLLAVMSTNPVYSVLFLAGTALTISAWCIFAGAEFLGLMISIVYIGAIIILFLFIVMLLTLDEFFVFSISWFDLIIFCICIFFFSELLGFMFYQQFPFFSYLDNTLWQFSSELALPVFSDQIGAIGSLLFTDYIAYVLLCGLLLLVILMGVVLILKTYSERVLAFKLSTANQKSAQLTVNFISPTSRVLLHTAHSIINK